MVTRPTFTWSSDQPGVAAQTFGAAYLMRRKRWWVAASILLLLMAG